MPNKTKFSIINFILLTLFLPSSKKKKKKKKKEERKKERKKERRRREFLLNLFSRCNLFNDSRFESYQ